MNYLNKYSVQYTEYHSDAYNTTVRLVTDHKRPTFWEMRSPFSGVWADVAASIATALDAELAALQAAPEAPEQAPVVDTPDVSHERAVKILRRHSYSNRAVTADAIIRIFRNDHHAVLTPGLIKTKIWDRDHYDPDLSTVRMHLNLMVKSGALRRNWGDEVQRINGYEINF